MIDKMIRKAELNEMPSILPLYEKARVYMRENGNPTQWKEGYPSETQLKQDIEEGNYYVIVDEGRILGGFSFIIGIEPTYREIDGAWLNHNPYGTIHRLVSGGLVKGIADMCIAFCAGLIDELRIDTHEDNHPMRKAIERNGFTYCGIIKVADGSPRLGFHKTTKL